MLNGPGGIGRNCTSIPLTNDNVPERAKTFTVTLSRQMPFRVDIYPDEATITIVDDDGK